VVLTGQLSRRSAGLADLRERTIRTLCEPAAKGRAEPSARQQQRRLTAREAVAVAREYRAGADMRLLARKYGVHRTTISGCLTRLAVPRHEVGMAPGDVPEAAQLYRTGWSLARLSAKYGCTDNTVRARLLEVGVVMRPQRGGRKRRPPCKG
jgi:lambda repressor-like predicted transcriptional regulator